jgi:tRNA G37 N-methylase TrmD
MEHAQDTRPDKYPLNKKKSWDVPEVLLSGDHKKIEEWRSKRK